VPIVFVVLQKRSTGSEDGMTTGDARLEELDAVIIGTGQAGKPLAGALAEAGWKTAIVEKGRVGGTCVVEGCTPTKTMIASARVAHLARRSSDYGVDTGPVSVDMEVVRGRKRAIVDSWSAGSERGMTRHDSLELVRGTAVFTAPLELEVRGPGDGGSSVLRRFRADHVFINSGARPRIPDIPGLDSTPHLTSTTIMELDTVPSHLVVLGGGFVGLEFAQMFRRFGSEVTVLEAGHRLAAREDDDVSDAMTDVLEEDGIRVVVDARAVEVEASEAGIRLRLEDDEAIEGSHLLVATGRVPSSGLLEPTRAGVDVDDQGYIRVDDRCRTSADNVWAMGDVTGAPPFTHIAYDDFRVVRSQLLGDGTRTRAGRAVTYTVFTDPQLGRVGLSEREAREAGHPVRVAKLPMSRAARAIETDETRGFMKAVVHAETGLILGATVFGVEGGEVVSVIQTAMMGRLPYTALRDGIFPHPTLSESLNNLFTTI
jgi:pyruvate/2-oxoglutarate dehydrogenase complex dihydrolipoamide dehydrogenase (E3) component